MAHVEEKYHNNPYFQTLFVRFALDWIGKNIYVLLLNLLDRGSSMSLHDVEQGNMPR